MLKKTEADIMDKDSEPVTLKFYFKSGTVISIPHVVFWRTTTNVATEGITGINLRWLGKRGVERPIVNSWKLSEIVAITETTE